MKAAYKDADGIKILGRRIVVDVERGRTVKGWKPKRLGKINFPCLLFIYQPQTSNTPMISFLSTTLL